MSSEASETDTITTEEREKSVQQPVTTTYERGESSQQPVTTTYERGESSQQPVTTTYERGESSQQPVTTTNESGKSSQQPLVITTNESGGEPEHIDNKLYLAAYKGYVGGLEDLLRPEQVESVINVQDDVAPVVRSAAVSLLGVTHAGDTALHIATCFGRYEAAEWICNKNRSLLMQPNKKAETPLHYAAQAGNLELVKLFIQKADDNAADLVKMENRDGETALYQAIHHCQVLVVDSPRRMYFKFSPLHFHIGKVEQVLAENGKHADVVAELLRANGNLASIGNNNNISPLYLAVMKNSRAIVTSLVQKLCHESASEAAYLGPDGRTALHAAALRSSTGFINQVDKLRPRLTKRTDNLHGSTPLHYAASANNPIAVCELLKIDKASAYIADALGLYPIHVAARFGFEQVVAEFFVHCPDSDELLDHKGRNFLHLAVEERSVNVVRWACQKSDEFMKAMNSQENNGDTPIHLAIKGGDLKIFSLLLASGKARICIMNRDGLTPIDVATANKTVGFWNRQNPDLIIERVLCWIGCLSGIYRYDYFLSEKMLLTEEKIEKNVQNLENMAKNMAIGSTLIASAAFAGIFTVSIAYRDEAKTDPIKPGLSLAFKAFVLMATHAFICSIATTALIVEAALNFLQPTYRKNFVLHCSRLVIEAIKSFIVAFALGVLVMMISVSQWRLGCLLCLICCVLPVLVQPQFWPDILVQMALIRYLGIKRFSLVGGHIFFRNISYGVIVLLILFTGRSSKADLVEHVVLTIITVMLLFMSYPLFLPILGTRNLQTNYITIRIGREFFLIILLSLVTYLVLFFPFDHLRESSSHMFLLMLLVYISLLMFLLSFKNLQHPLVFNVLVVSTFISTLTSAIVFILYHSLESSLVSFLWTLAMLMCIYVSMFALRNLPILWPRGLRYGLPSLGMGFCFSV